MFDVLGTPRPRSAIALSALVAALFANEPSAQAAADTQGSNAAVATSAATPASGPAQASAHQASTVTAGKVQLGGLLGLATAGLNLGVGARGGYTWENRLYLGGTFTFHLAHSSSYAVEGVGRSSTSASVFYVGPEVGYDIPLPPVIIRPYFGLGMATARVSVSSSSGGSASWSGSEVVAWPGGAILVPLSNSHVLLGGDLRMLVISGGPSLGAFGSATWAF